jgi:hypothetical protein
VKHFYVYYSYEEWGRGYIGRRECTCLPSEDVRYFGSFTDKSFRPTQKIILATFDTREEMCQAEVDLHAFYEVERNPHFANKARQTSSKFYMDMTGENNPVFGKRWNHTEEFKRERSRRYMGRKGTPRTEEQKEKIRQTRKLRGCGLGNSFAKGNRFNLTEEQKENRRQAALRRPEVVCPVCGKVCKGNAGLTLHMKIHKKN